MSSLRFSLSLQSVHTDLHSSELNRSSVHRRRVSCESLNNALLHILFRPCREIQHGLTLVSKILPKIANHLIVTKELHMPCFNGSLLPLKPFEGQLFELVADFTDTSNDNCPSWERERIHELSPSNSLLDHIFRLNEFIDIDQQKKISRSVPQAIQVTPSSEKTKFLGHSALLEDASDASFDRRSISR